MRVWKSKSGLDAKYKNLLGIFVTAGHDAGAKAVCIVLQKKGKMWYYSFSTQQHCMNTDRMHIGVARILTRGIAHLTHFYHKHNWMIS